MTRIATMAVLAFLQAVSATGTSTEDQGATARLSFGTIHGNLLENAAEFLGIPYAAKPVRFAEAVQWDQAYTGGQLEARRYTPACMQYLAIPQVMPASTQFSEDCLHLNIYTPRVRAAKVSLPVMLWLHGGALVMGTAMQNCYNGTNLATKQDIVVVAANYRLGSFGFSAIKRQDGTPVANLGYKDQREAMRWVKHHIYAFGGDAARVTIFGESAGGQSVMAHVISQGSAALFEQAISESGVYSQSQALESALVDTDKMATGLGCTAGAADLDCLRKVDPLTLSKAVSQVNWAVIDGDFFETDPLTLISEKRYNHVPFIIGNNANEGNLWFISGTGQPATASDAKCVFDRSFKDAAFVERILQMYPTTEGQDNRYVISDVASDLGFHCDNRRVMQAMIAGDSFSPLWAYSFRRSPAGCRFMVNIPGAFHGVEVGYVWDNLRDASLNINEPMNCTPSKEDAALAARVSGLFADFARNGSPEIAWPKYSAPHGQMLKLDESTVLDFSFESGYRRAQCELLDEVYTDTKRLQDAISGIFSSLPLCQAHSQVPGSTIHV